MLLHRLSTEQMAKMLENLNRWLDAARKHAEAKKFDVETLLGARLAPDQFPLMRQLQSACDAAKFTAARLVGKTPPRHADDETTLDQIQARIREVIGYLRSFAAADFEDAAERSVVLPFLEGRTIRGEDYLVEMQIPNFHFHVVTAYAILRHNGVDLGKRDFIGGLTLQ